MQLLVVCPSLELQQPPPAPRLLSGLGRRGTIMTRLASERENKPCNSEYVGMLPRICLNTDTIYEPTGKAWYTGVHVHGSRVPGSLVPWNAAGSSCRCEAVRTFTGDLHRRDSEPGNTAEHVPCHETSGNTHHRHFCRADPRTGSPLLVGIPSREGV